VKNRSTILSVYGPVLLAALLIFTAAPACAMPDCGMTGTSGVASSCDHESQFKSACELDGAGVPAAPEPCGNGTCDDAVMSHGTPDAVAVSSVEVPTAVAVAQAPRIPALISLGISRAPLALTEPDPPDPLGVRLTV